MDLEVFSQYWNQNSSAIETGIIGSLIAVILAWVFRVVLLNLLSGIWAALIRFYQRIVQKLHPQPSARGCPEADNTVSHRSAKVAFPKGVENFLQSKGIKRDQLHGFLAELFRFCCERTENGSVYFNFDYALKSRYVLDTLCTIFVKILQPGRDVVIFMPPAQKSPISNYANVVAALASSLKKNNIDSERLSPHFMDEQEAIISLRALSRNDESQVFLPVWVDLAEHQSGDNERDNCYVADMAALENLICRLDKPAESISKPMYLFRMKNAGAPRFSKNTWKGLPPPPGVLVTLCSKN